MNIQQNPGGGGGGQNVPPVVAAPNQANVAAGAAPNQANVAAAPVNGGITATGQVWTGGSGDPAARALPNRGPRTPMCNRSDAINHRVWARCEKGVDEAWQVKLSNTLPLSTCEPIIHGGLKDVGVDSVFWININGVWGDLFLHPDAAPLADIRVHEQGLRLACSYDRENLLFSRKYLENSVDQELRRKVAPSLLPSDGGPVFWSLVKVALHGAENSKLIRHQKVINETQLVNFAGYDVSKYHEVLLPSLQACNEANHLPLNVGPTVIKNHMGPSSLGYKSVVTTYAGEQASLHDTNAQYRRLVPQMDSLREIALNDLDWEKVEGPKGAYTSQLRQKDISQIQCYNCGEYGHFKKNCPNKKKKKSNGGSAGGSAGGSNNNNGGKKKKWENSNPDNKETLEKDGKTYHWCKHCKFGRGTWTNHKSADHIFKGKKSTSNDSAENTEETGSGFLVMDLIEGGFLAVDIL